MTTITADERDFIRHALGLTRQKIGYRNYFSAGPKDEAIGRALVARGLAVVREPTPAYPDPVFYITTKGFHAAKEVGEIIDFEERDRIKYFDRQAKGL